MKRAANKTKSNPKLLYHTYPQGFKSTTIFFKDDKVIFSNGSLAQRRAKKRQNHSLHSLLYYSLHSLFYYYFRKCPLCNNSVRVLCSNMGTGKEIKRISQMMTTKSSEEGEKYKVDNIAIESIKTTSIDRCCKMVVASSFLTGNINRII